ncbi:hypothetical protein A2U01_0102925 [Trifolium medium]|uniref:Uncharacterized protein n=1 Tax=Trifolium medium TaxID=97028 RepID=A0A392V3L9_9FABA|nr:hypothetical protein [Trifolium medium]
MGADGSSQTAFTRPGLRQAQPPVQLGAPGWKIGHF